MNRDKLNNLNLNEVDPLDIDDDGDGLSETKETVTTTMQISTLEPRNLRRHRQQLRWWDW